MNDEKKRIYIFSENVALFMRLIYSEKLQKKIRILVFDDLSETERSFG